MGVELAEQSDKPVARFLRRASSRLRSLSSRTLVGAPLRRGQGKSSPVASKAAPKSASVLKAAPAKQPPPTSVLHPQSKATLPVLGSGGGQESQPQAHISPLDTYQIQNPLGRQLGGAAAVGQDRQAPTPRRSMRRQSRVRKQSQ